MAIWRHEENKPIATGTVRAARNAQRALVIIVRA